MENKPTKQYLDYLISKYTDTPDAGINGKEFNILQLNIKQYIKQSEFQHSASPQAIQTNRCANDNTESNNNI